MLQVQMPDGHLVIGAPDDLRELASLLPPSCEDWRDAITAALGE
jgi:hypothetical protein